MMSKRSAGMILAAVLACLLAVGSIYAAQPVSTPAPVPESQTYDLALGSGTITNSALGLETSKKLSKSNGQYLNLYVENLGDVPVIASINGESKRTFMPGEKGHITVIASWWDRYYDFAVTPQSGQATFFYAMAQRENPVP